MQLRGSKFCVAQIGHFVDCDLLTRIIKREGFRASRVAADLETVPLRIELSDELEVVLQHRYMRRMRLRRELLSRAHLVNLEPLRILLLRVLL